MKSVERNLISQSALPDWSMGIISAYFFQHPNNFNKIGKTLRLFSSAKILFFQFSQPEKNIFFCKKVVFFNYLLLFQCFLLLKRFFCREKVPFSANSQSDR